MGAADSSEPGAQLTLRSDARANHARLLQAAASVFAERGVDADVKCVAERADLAVGTIYRHFAGKDELVAAVIEQAIGEFGQAIEQGLACADAGAALQTYLRAALRVIERYGEVMAALQEGRVPAARSAATRASEQAGIAERITSLLQRAVEGGVVRADVELSTLVQYFRFGLVQWAIGELRRGKSPDEVADQYLDLFMRGAQAAAWHATS